MERLPRALLKFIPVAVYIILQSVITLGVLAIFNVWLYPLLGTVLGVIFVHNIGYEIYITKWRFRDSEAIHAFLHQKFPAAPTPHSPFQHSYSEGALSAMAASTTSSVEKGNNSIRITHSGMTPRRPWWYRWLPRGSPMASTSFIEDLKSTSEVGSGITGATSQLLTQQTKRAITGGASTTGNMESVQCQTDMGNSHRYMYPWWEDTSFLSRLSHQMNTGLHGILGAAQVLDNLPLDKVIQPLVDIILRSTHMLRNLTHDFFDFIQLQQGSLSLTSEAFPLAEFLEHLKGSLQPELSRPEVQFQIITSPHSGSTAAGEMLFGDQARINQVVTQLLGNACEAVRTSKVKQITLHAIFVPSRVQFVILDTGCGMEEEEVKNILHKPFYQRQLTTPNVTAGCGMGVVLADALITRMGGELTLQSKLGQGTQVTFWIPQPAQPACHFNATSSSATIPVENISLASSAQARMSHILCEVVESATTTTTPSTTATTNTVTTEEAVVPADFVEENAISKWQLPNSIQDFRDRETSYELGKVKTVLASGIQYSTRAITTPANTTIIPPSPTPTTGFARRARMYLVDDSVINLRLLHHMIEIVYSNKKDPRRGSRGSRGGSGSSDSSNSGGGGGSSNSNSGGCDGSIDSSWLEVICFHSPTQALQALLLTQTFPGQSSSGGRCSSSGSSSSDSNHRSESPVILPETQLLLLTDFHMPEMTGVELTQALRHHFSHTRLPIVGLTADCSPEVTLQCQQVGMQFVLHKPVDLLQLTQVVTQWIPLE